MRSAGAVILAASILCGCTTVTPESIAANDPFEPANRAVYKFDEKFDKYIVLPAAGLYIFYMPPLMRRSLHNVLNNFDMPVTVVNDVLQGEFEDAGSSFGRLAMNSTIGLGGLVDVATQAGLRYKPADFGQTLGRYGMPEGPFLVVPFIGPDPPRDLLGDAGDLALDPLFYLPPDAPLWEHALLSATVKAGGPFEVHARNIVLRRELERGSVDPYVTMRGTYRQLREEEISERAGYPDPK